MLPHGSVLGLTEGDGACEIEYGCHHHGGSQRQHTGAHTGGKGIRHLKEKKKNSK